MSNKFKNDSHLLQIEQAFIASPGSVELMSKKFQETGRCKYQRIKVGIYGIIVAE